MNSKQIQQWLISNYGLESGNIINYRGLQRTRSIFEYYILDLKLQEKIIFTIAGTNGKGQTCRFLHAFLTAGHAGCALWTSPHYVDVRERFVYNKTNISEKSMWEVVQKVHHKFSDMDLSYYEFLFACFCQWCSELKPLKYLILEVGLGGRLDSVNHFDADYAAITSISRDHIEILGNSYRDILQEKMGICRSNKRLITTLELTYLRNLVKKHCNHNNVLWQDLFESKKISAAFNYQSRNFILAKTLASFECQIDTGRRDILKNDDFHSWIWKWPSLRKEGMTLGDIHFTFIGTHNLDGIRKLCERWPNTHMKINRCIWAFGQRPFKEIEYMVTLITNSFSKNQSNIYFTHFEHPKALNADIARDLIRPKMTGSVCWWECWQKEIDKLINETKTISNEKDKRSNHLQYILVGGSNYFIGTIQEYLGNYVDDYIDSFQQHSIIPREL